MRIDSSHRKWLIASVVILAVSTGIYIPYAAESPHGPSGASALGLTFGTAGFAFMIFAGLLGARKKVPVWRVGRAQAWMRGHLWLGILSLPLILFHGGFRFGGPLTATLMVLLIIVVLSGIFGAVLQHYVPNVMTSEVPLETIFEQIGHVRGQLLEEADGFVEDVTAPNGPLVVAAAARASATTTEELPAVSEKDVAPLQQFYVREMRPFLQNSGSRSHALRDTAKSIAIFAALRTVLPPEVHQTVRDLEEICEEERQLRRQSRLHHMLHDWLLLHVPLSLALLLLGAIHAVMALRY
ncbi:MAG TPA: cytochrome b/b6 domain-containing protein [Verrucomicrobiae bacterium]|nr:cytochrome b/b6 domain-containing protein [Verrucomicrobiae bacterium]